MTEYTLELEPQAEPGGSRWTLVERVVNLVVGPLLLLWTWKWLPAMWEGVRTQTDLGQNGLGSRPSAHQVFEVIFVAAHWGVRWLPGVVALALLLVVTRRMSRRALA